MQGAVFPEEVMLCIADFLDRRTIIRLRLVSRAFFNVALKRYRSEIDLGEYEAGRKRNEQIRRLW